VSASAFNKNNAEFAPALPGFEHVNRYWDKVNNSVAAKILPGEFYVTTQREIIATVLGSCVSACIRDPIFGVGGMNHFMLPMSITNGSWNGSEVNLATRYGNYAMEHLINEILKNGGIRQNLEVKIFGGARILKQMTDIGIKNIQFVRAYLNTENIDIVSEDVGDICPRKVQYIPATGKVRIKKLRSLHNDTISQREQKYIQEIESTPADGEIDLF